MSFGIYIHIPYCLQRCTYCDFATYVHSEILPPPKYFDLLKKEAAFSAHLFPKGPLSTVYFGGGTPSLIDSSLIVDLIQNLNNLGFTTGPETEITLEINPATIDSKKMEDYLKAGINRFSVGAQTFNDSLLKSVNREHNSRQTRETLAFLKSYQVTYSFDVLFALPGQSLEDLHRDLDEVVNFGPQHVSPYCLTVPEGHPLSKVRLSEDTQVKMFEVIDQRLKEAGYLQYEISNYCRPGFESRHNTLYWTDQPYWGIGLSAHSYMPKVGAFGRRFWNPPSIGAYQSLLESLALEPRTPGEYLPDQFREDLEVHQSLTDFCHTFLRTASGLSLDEVQAKYGAKISHKIAEILRSQAEIGLVKDDDGARYSLTSEGQLVSNQVYAALTFLPGEISL
ncbi:MAG: radical SAM family heme chaperone HemW [Pseudobdellovibrionaceae bacterium]